MHDDLEAEIAKAIELPKLTYRPIEEYDGSFAVFRARWAKAFGRGDGSRYYEVIDGESYPISWEPTEWALVLDEKNRGLCGRLVC